MPDLSMGLLHPGASQASSPCSCLIVEQYCRDYGCNLYYPGRKAFLRDVSPESMPTLTYRSTVVTEGKTPSMENVMPGVLIDAISPPTPPEKPKQAAVTPQPLPRQVSAAAAQPARVVQGFSLGKGPQGIVARAQVSLCLRCSAVHSFPCDPHLNKV